MPDITIDVIDRGVFKSDLNYMVEGATMATLDDQNPDIEFVDNQVYNLVIDHPDGTILWDTGIHPEAGDGHWPDWLYQAFPMEDASDHRLEDDLEEAGWGLADIDYVFQTHLHVDHAGGLELFADIDVPVFIHEDELKYAYFSATTDQGSAGYVVDDFHHDLDWRVVNLERVGYFDGIEFLHLPGHTPGVMGTLVHLDDDRSVLFTSDEIYREENYREATPLGAGLLWDRPQWHDSLRLVRELERQHDADIVFGHDPLQFDEIREGWS